MHHPRHVTLAEWGRHTTGNRTQANENGEASNIERGDTIPAVTNACTHGERTREKYEGMLTVTHATQE